LLPSAIVSGSWATQTSASERIPTSGWGADPFAGRTTRVGVVPGAQLGCLVGVVVNLLLMRRACGVPSDQKTTCPLYQACTPGTAFWGEVCRKGNMIDFDHMHRGGKNPTVRLFVRARLFQGFGPRTHAWPLASAYLSAPGKKYCGAGPSPSLCSIRWGTPAILVTDLRKTMSPECLKANYFP